ncbi:hypothetical protein [Nocardia sp. NPDC059239]|uniref:hypothetical protein n=1 Tax=Nocardia sp. NPDC059239 TaxID=3346785 RepID=UPI0036896392
MRARSLVAIRGDPASGRLITADLGDVSMAQVAQVQEGLRRLAIASAEFALVDSRPDLSGSVSVWNAR